MCSPKHKLQTIVFYMADNKIHSARVLALKIVKSDSMIPMPEEFGKAGIQYATCHGIFDESQVYGSKEELLATL